MKTVTAICALFLVLALGACGSTAKKSEPPTSAVTVPAAVTVSAACSTAMAKDAADDGNNNDVTIALTTAEMNACTKAMWFTEINKYTGTDINHDLVVSGNEGAKRLADQQDTFVASCGDALPAIPASCVGVKHG